MSITRTPIEGQQDLNAQLSIVHQNALGPICMFGAYETKLNPDGCNNLLTYSRPGARDNKVVLQVVPAGAALDKPGHVLVCLGQAFVSGTLQTVAVFRPV